MKPRIVLVACCEYGADIFEPLLESKMISIDYIVCLDENFAKKNRVSGYYNFTNIAKKFNIKVYHPIKYSLSSNEDLQFFVDNKFDVMFLGGWQRLIPQNVLDTLTIGAFGLHGSSEFLPKGKGRSPINWSLIENKKRFILHLFKLNSNIDDGDIVDIETFDINEFDNCKTLYYKCSICARKMIVKNYEKILNNSYKAIKQVGEPEYYVKRTPDDGYIDFYRKDVFEIYNFIRALTRPYPGAFSFINEEKIYLWKAQIFDTRITYYKAQYGEIVEVFNSGDFIINCRGGLLLVTEYEGNKIKNGYVIK